MPAKRTKIDKDKLYELYMNQGLSMNKISLLENCSESFVKTNLSYYNIPIKSCSQYSIPALSKEQLILEYVDNDLPIHVIAQKYKCNFNHVSKLLTKYNIPKRKDPKFRKGKTNPKWKGGEIVPSSLHYDYKHGAERRSIEFNITISDMEQQYLKQNGCCAISKQPISLPISRSEFKKSTASLDRIDSSKGYTPDNIQWVHKKIQQMKWNIPQNEFIEWCKIISDNY
jgi:hypothetical protein